MTTIEQSVELERTRRSILLEFVKKHQGPGDHEGGTPQSTHGRGARNASAGTIKSDTESQGGVTIRTMSGERPEEGFAVAMPDVGLKLPQARASEKRIRGYIRDNWDTLSAKGNFLGTWNDTDNGVVWFDVVKVMTGEGEGYSHAFEAALKFGESHGEEAIYDLKNNVEIHIGDEAGISAHRELIAV